MMSILGLWFKIDFETYPLMIGSSAGVMKVGLKVGAQVFDLRIFQGSLKYVAGYNGDSVSLKVLSSSIIDFSDSWSENDSLSDL